MAVTNDTHSACCALSCSARCRLFISRACCRAGPQAVGDPAWVVQARQEGVKRSSVIPPHSCRRPQEAGRDAQARAKQQGRTCGTLWGDEPALPFLPSLDEVGEAAGADLRRPMACSSSCRWPSGCMPNSFCAWARTCMCQGTNMHVSARTCMCQQWTRQRWSSNAAVATRREWCAVPLQNPAPLRSRMLSCQAACRRQHGARRSAGIGPCRHLISSLRPVFRSRLLRACPGESANSSAEVSCHNVSDL